MLAYKDLVSDVLLNGVELEGRNGMMLNTFGKQLELPYLEAGFPIITGRQMHYKGVLGELAAFLYMPKHITDFREMGCNYWDDWADAEGNINVDYGNAWQNFNGTNQLQEIARNLRKDPFSRRHVLTGWDPSHISELSLPCCHYAYQWMVDDLGRLDMLWIQRSADVMIGLPSDMIAAATLNILMAQTVGLHPGRIIMQLGSTHIYGQHVENAQVYLKRETYPLPKWTIDDKATLFNFRPEMLILDQYQHSGPLKFELIV